MTSFIVRYRINGEDRWDDLRMLHTLEDAEWCINMVAAKTRGVSYSIFKREDTEVTPTVMSARFAGGPR